MSEGCGRFRRRLAAAGIAAMLVMGASAGAQAKVTIRLMTHAYNPFNMWIISKIKAYEKINPSVQVNYTYIDHGLFDQKIFVSLASGSAPDILNVYYPTLTDLVRGNFLDQPPASVTQEIKANFIPPAWKGMQIDGRLWGYPTEAQMILPVANEEYFRTAGVPFPTSYDELVSLQRKLTLKDSNGKLQRIGVSLSTGGLWQMLHWSAMMRAYGGEILSPDGTKALISSPESIKATELYKELALFTVPTGDFEKNKTGIRMTCAHDRNLWLKTAKSLEPKALPAFTASDGQKLGTSYHWGFVVSKPSKRKKEAWAFVSWLNSPVNRLDLTKEVGFPSTTYYEIDHFKKDAWMTMFSQEFQYGRPLPGVQRWKQVEAAITESITKFLSAKQMGADQALRLAEQQSNIILKRNVKK